MTELRENIDLVVSSILASLALVIGWLVQSGIAVALISVLIGAGISYFVTSRTQKRQWKREYAIRTVETIYAPLFDDLKGIARVLENKYYTQSSFTAWGAVRESHKYLMIDKPFRTRLDEFYEALEKYSLTVYNLRNKIVPKIYRTEARQIFELKNDIYETIFVKTVDSGITMGFPTVTECILKRMRLQEYIAKSHPELTRIENYTFRTVDGKDFHSHDWQKVENLWDSCIAVAEKDGTFQFVRSENDRLLHDAKELLEELAKRIEEPWRA